MMENKLSKDFIVLGITGKELNPDKITECLGMSPHSSAHKGDVFITPSGMKKRSKQGYWSCSFDSTLKIDEQFSQLTDGFKNKAKLLKKIIGWKSVEEAYVEIVTHPASDYGIHSVLLKAENVQLWGSVGFDIVVSVWNPLCYEEFVRPKIKRKPRGEGKATSNHGKRGRKRK